MKLKIWLPWICFLVSLAAFGVVYLSDQKKEARLAQLSEENQQLQASQAQVEESKKAEVEKQNEELIRLRKDNEDLLRLRSEVRRLQDDKQQLAKQAQTAQSQAEAAQTLAQAARLQAQQVAAQQAAAQQAAAAIAGKQQAGTCINNLRQIDGAKQQWALENRKTADAIPTVKDLAPYLGRDADAFPVCPAGGTYQINAVGVPPTCSLPNHVLQ